MTKTTDRNSVRRRRPAVWTFAGFALAGIAALWSAATLADPPLPPQKPQSLEALPEQSQPAAPSCAARLVAVGVETRPAPASKTGPAGTASNAVADACMIVDPVVMTALRPPEPGDPMIALPDSPLVSCAMAETFGAYVRDIAAPLAKGLYGTPVEVIGTGPGFECRTRNHVAGAKVSAHAQGDALDIAAITLANRIRISVEAPADERARRYLFALRAAACGVFSTVLGPGSDPFHANHLHFDILARGRDGKTKFCQ